MDFDTSSSSTVLTSITYIIFCLLSLYRYSLFFYTLPNSAGLTLCNDTYKAKQNKQRHMISHCIIVDDCTWIQKAKPYKQGIEIYSS